MLSQWVKEAISFAKTNQSQLARDLTARLGKSIDRAAVNKMTIGKRSISAAEMLAIADITGFAPFEERSQILNVPLVDWVSAGQPSLRDGHLPFEDFPQIEAVGLSEGDWIALRVEGDSMDRISPPESVIFVDTGDKRLAPNACYVICTEEGGATYKRYRPNPDRFEPVTFNPDHEPIFPNGSVHVIGRVRRTTLDM